MRFEVTTTLAVGLGVGVATASEGTVVPVGVGGVGVGLPPDVQPATRATAARPANSRSIMRPAFMPHLLRDAPAVSARWLTWRSAPTLAPAVGAAHSRAALGPVR